jgi:integrase
LKAALDAALKEKRSAVTILVNSFGRPWTEDGFRTSWDKAFRKTSLKDLHFHDLRGTAVTRLALSNCSVPEIASITGHSMKTVQEILDAHYLGGRVELAESAIKKLSEVYRQKQKMNSGCGSMPGGGVPGRQGFCVRECSPPPGTS